MRAALAALLLLGGCAVYAEPVGYPHPSTCIEYQYPRLTCEEGYIWQPGFYTVYGHRQHGRYSPRGPSPRVRDHRSGR